MEATTRPIIADFPTALRNVRYRDLAAVLETHQKYMVDVIAPAGTVRSKDGDLDLIGGRVVPNRRNIDTADGRFAPTPLADTQLARLLTVPDHYLHQLREHQQLSLFDAVINGHVHSDTQRIGPLLLRLIVPEEPRFTQTGLVRAVLPADCGVLDHLEVINAVAAGVKEAGAEVRAYSADLTETSLRVHLHATKTMSLATTILDGFAAADIDNVVYRQHDSASIYRVPDPSLHVPRSNIVFAGMRLSNSETGAHGVELTPELVLADTGMRLPMPELTRKHQWATTGGSHRHTVVDNLAAVSALAAEVAAQWLTSAFLTEIVEALSSFASSPVTTPRRVATTCAELGFTAGECDGVLAHFAAAHRSSELDLPLSIAAYSQTVTDTHRAWQLHDLALNSLRMGDRHHDQARSAGGG